MAESGFPACPSCGSTSNRYLSAILEDGTSDYSGVSGAYVVEGTRRSHAAQQAAPPRKLGLGWPIVGVVAAYSVTPYTPSGVAAALQLLAWLWLAFVLYHNTVIYKREYRAWRHTLRCARCGTYFSDGRA